MRYVATYAILALVSAGLVVAAFALDMHVAVQVTFLMIALFCAIMVDRGIVAMLNEHRAPRAPTPLVENKDVYWL